MLPGVVALDVASSAERPAEDLSEADLERKTVMILCDFNVPLNADLEITDEARHGLDPRDRVPVRQGRQGARVLLPGPPEGRD